MPEIYRVYYWMEDVFHQANVEVPLGASFAAAFRRFLSLPDDAPLPRHEIRGVYRQFWIAAGEEKP